MNLKKYYNSKKYLKEHHKYFSEKQLQKDVDFLVNALNLKKGDKILDLCCGHGRHTIELKKRGFSIDGLDFSKYLLRIAKTNAKRENLKINFYQQDIHSINIENKYDKIFLFFSEFGLFDPDIVLSNVVKLLKNQGIFLLDFDNVFRLVQKLAKSQKSDYEFDVMNMELKEKGNKKRWGVRYYTFSELKLLLNKAGLKIDKAFGDYNGSSLTIASRRMIVRTKKSK